MKTTVFSGKAPKPIGPYNQAVKAGKFLFVSGQLAIDPNEGKIVTNDVTGQTKQVIETYICLLWIYLMSSTMNMPSALMENFLLMPQSA
jgi:2-iminobutanoate/2-iminopropanoate deaminase